MENEVDNENHLNEIPPAKREKILHAIYMKAKLFTRNEIDFSNIYDTIVLVMREINKSDIKSGITKKRLALSLIMLLLGDFGVPILVGIYCVVTVGTLIEKVYLAKHHRVRSGRMWRFLR